MVMRHGFLYTISIENISLSPSDGMMFDDYIHGTIDIADGYLSTGSTLMVSVSILVDGSMMKSLLILAYFASPPALISIVTLTRHSSRHDITRHEQCCCA